MKIYEKPIIKVTKFENGDSIALGTSGTVASTGLSKGNISVFKGQIK